jgi:hypothetical protein
MLPELELNRADGLIAVRSCSSYRTNIKNVANYTSSLSPCCHPDQVDFSWFEFAVCMCSDVVVAIILSVTVASSHGLFSLFDCLMASILCLASSSLTKDDAIKEGGMF